MPQKNPDHIIRISLKEVVNLLAFMIRRKTKYVELEAAETGLGCAIDVTVLKNGGPSIGWELSQENKDCENITDYDTW